MRCKLIPLLGLPLILLTTAIIYWPGINGGLTLDDFPNIVNNKALVLPNLHLDSLLAAAYSINANILGRPLSMLSFAINIYASGGVLPGPMKITNILIHLANGLLVYIFISMLLRAWSQQYGRDNLKPDAQQLTALLVTAAWLLAPINLTSVLYVVQRMTSLSGSFVLLGCIVYLWARLRMLNNRAGLLWLISGMIICSIVGILFKESAALLPVYTLVIEWTLFSFRRSDGHRDWRLYALYIFTLLLPGVAGLLWLGPGLLHGFDNRPFTLSERLLTEPRVVLDYVKWILVPTPGALSLYHDDYPFSRSLFNPPVTIFAIAGILSLLGVALWQRKRRPLLSLGVLWFLGGQLLTATVFNLELVYEHRNYLPSLGLLLGLFTLLLHEPRLRGWRHITTGLALVLVLLYGIVTAMRAHEWSNPLRYAIISATEHPRSPRATYQLGQVYSVLAITHPNNDELHALATTTLHKAMLVPNSSILPESALLIMDARTGHPLDETLWQHIRNKLRAAPSSDNLTALSSLIDCQREGDCKFPPQQMLTTLNTALRLHPDKAGLYNLSAIYANEVLRRPDIARGYIDNALRLSPNNGNLWFNRFTIDMAQRDYRAAQEDIQKLSRLDNKGNYRNKLRSMRHTLQQAQSHAPDNLPSSQKKPIP